MRLQSVNLRPDQMASAEREHRMPLTGPDKTPVSGRFQGDFGVLSGPIKAIRRPAPIHLSGIWDFVQSVQCHTSNEPTFLYAEITFVNTCDMLPLSPKAIRAR